MNRKFALRAHRAREDKNLPEDAFPDCEELLRRFEICHIYPTNEIIEHIFDLNCPCKPDIEMQRSGILAIHKQLKERKGAGKFYGDSIRSRIS